MFVRDREVPVGWQEDLDRLKKEGLNWLKLVWQPGEEWEPIQRWEIYEMIPRLEHVPLEIVEELKGVDPRLRGDWHRDADGQVATPRVWDSDALISRMQWQLYHATGCFSQRFWIIQGENGGHKWRLGTAEKNCLEKMGSDWDTPLPGDLPYVDYDQRVFRQLAEYDKLASWRMALAWDDRADRVTEAGLWVRRDRHAEEREYQEALYHWLDNQVEEAVSDIPRSMLPDMSEFTSADAVKVDEDALEEDLIMSTPTKV